MIEENLRKFEKSRLGIIFFRSETQFLSMSGSD
jgi:hypothetical protein